ncbi:YrzE family protein [Rothia halotolerans]|uniref:YrzE family protein n=1 Tax=Rothia halotolerans TaxID=405770 RepID=UPI00101CC962|nr:YrzE family protein [Rothia halotolerans]
MSRERPYDRDDPTEPLPREPRRGEDPDATVPLPAGSWRSDDPNATVPLDGSDGAARGEPREEPWDGRRLDHEPTEVLEDNRTLPLGTVPPGSEDPTAVIGRDGRESLSRGPAETAPTQPLRPEHGYGAGGGREHDDARMPPTAGMPTVGGATAGASAGATAQRGPGSSAAPDGYPAEPGAGIPGSELRAAVTRRQRVEYGRIQLLPGLIGWLAAVGMAGFLGWAAALLLPALTGLTPAAAPGGALEDLAEGSAAGLAGSIGFAAVYLVSFLFGGYAAGRSARFAGAKQGVAVWLWQLMGAAVSTVLAMIFADQVPGLPALATVQAMGAESLLWNVLAALCVLAIGLLAAVLGGLWGLRFHQRADRLGFEAR